MEGLTPKAVLLQVVARRSGDRAHVERCDYEWGKPLTRLQREIMLQLPVSLLKMTDPRSCVVIREKGRVVFRSPALHLAVLSGNVAAVRRLLSADVGLARERALLDLAAPEVLTELTAVQCIAYSSVPAGQESFSEEDESVLYRSRRSRATTAALVEAFAEAGVSFSERSGGTYHVTTKLSFLHRRWIACQTIHLAIEFGSLDLADAVLREEPRAIDAPGHFRGAWSYAGLSPLHVAALKCGEDLGYFRSGGRWRHRFDAPVYEHLVRRLIRAGAKLKDSRCTYSWRVRGAGVRLSRLSPAAVLLLQLPSDDEAAHPALMRVLHLLLSSDQGERKDYDLRLDGTKYEDFGRQSNAFDDADKPSNLRLYDTLLHFAMFHCRHRTAVDQITALTFKEGHLSHLDHRDAPMFHTANLRYTWCHQWPKLRLTYLKDPGSLFWALNADLIALIRDYVAQDPCRPTPSSSSHGVMDLLDFNNDYFADS